MNLPFDPTLQRRIQTPYLVATECGANADTGDAARHKREDAAVESFMFVRVPGLTLETMAARGKG